MPTCLGSTLPSVLFPHLCPGIHLLASVYVHQAELHSCADKDAHVSFSSSRALTELGVGGVGGQVGAGSHVTTLCWALSSRSLSLR